MQPAGDAPRDLADRLVREALRSPGNLHDFLAFALPGRGAGFVCEQARPLHREFLTEDWRGREADLIFEIPYRAAEGTQTALVCVLVEHQSDTDALVPLRTLYIAVGFWSRCWEAWARQARPKGALRLPPVLPIVLYTGARPWGSNRTLRDLLDEPEAFHDFAPARQPLFWNLADHTPEALLAGGPGMQLLTVMRVGPEEQAAFVALLPWVVGRLGELVGRDEVRWFELLRMILAYVTWRRSPVERAALVDVVVQSNQPREQEVRAMANTAAEAFMQQGLQQGLQQQLRQTRTMLRGLLTSKFGVLPEAVALRIEALTDPDRIQAIFEQALNVSRFEELQW